MLLLKLIFLLLSAQQRFPTLYRKKTALSHISFVSTNKGDDMNIPICQALRFRGPQSCSKGRAGAPAAGLTTHSAP